MSDIVLNFQPADAALGGAILGVATVGKLLLTGRILGISGSFKGTITEGDTSPWRFAFLGGLVASGMLDAAWNPAQVAEPSAGLMRTIVAGLLVGAGSGMGNGCTSGHGICGNSRFSPRSMAFTGLFMITGVATATLFNTNAALSVASTSALNNMLIPAKDTLLRYVGIAAAGAASFFGLRVFAKNASKKQDGDPSKVQDVIGNVAEALAGLLFGIGLTISGMRRAAKVSGFLSATSSSWDPSLMLVMAGGMGLAIPAFAAVNAPDAKPACTKSFSIPKNRNLDKKLVVGGVLFGAGWGLAGLCPGPAIVSMAARPTVGLGAWLVSVAAGMWGQHKLLK